MCSHISLGDAISEEAKLQYCLTTEEPEDISAKPLGLQKFLHLGNIPLMVSLQFTDDN